MEMKISKASDCEKHFVCYEIGCRRCDFCTCDASSVMQIDLMFYSASSDERIHLITETGDTEDDVRKQICARKEEFNAQLKPDNIRLTCFAITLHGIKQ